MKYGDLRPIPRDKRRRFIDKHGNVYSHRFGRQLQLSKGKKRKVTIELFAAKNKLKKKYTVAEFRDIKTHELISREKFRTEQAYERWLKRYHHILGETAGLVVHEEPAKKGDVWYNVFKTQRYKDLRRGIATRRKEEREFYRKKRR